jgi:DNA polymerase III alpha subunit (gram-positive type)
LAAGQDADAILARKCGDALKFHFAETVPQAVSGRMQDELGLIRKNGAATQYLIAASLAEEAHKNGRYLSQKIFKKFSCQ